MKFRAFASLMSVAVTVAAGALPLAAVAQPVDTPRGTVHAQPLDRTEPGRSKHQSPQQGQKSKGISPKQAISIAKQRQPGKVLSVQRTNGAYKIKMLHEGRVSYVTVSAY